MPLSDVSRDELQSMIAQLKESLYNHQQWYAGLIRILTCKLPADKRDISDEAHTECRFGQWYYSDAPEALRQHPGFKALGEEHIRLHHLAKLLLAASNSGNPVNPLDYDNFANTLERMQLEIFSLERELEDSLFNHDALTGAITRYGILPTLREQQELVKRHAQHCYVSMMDLDNFKAINDLHGHAAGDKVLASSVRYLLQNVRPYDKVFRYGGEEFLLCMPYTELESGLDRITELKDGIGTMEIDIGEKAPINIEASFGVTLLEPDISVEAAIDRADKALYAAKAAGRNCVKMWEPSMA